MKKAPPRKLTASRPMLPVGHDYQVIMRDMPFTGSTIAEKITFRKNMVHVFHSVAELTGLDEKDLAARTAVAEEMLLVPHAKRGEKVLQAASDAGKQTCRRYHDLRQKYRAALVEFMRQHGMPPHGHGTVSLSEARRRIAKKFGLNSKTVERNTRDLFKN